MHRKETSPARRYWMYATVVVLLLAMCYLPTGLAPVGGRWYKGNSGGGSVHSRMVTALYRRGPLGASVRVDDDVTVMGFYPPDCLVYEPKRQQGNVYAACGWRVPAPVAAYATGDYTPFTVGADGLRRTIEMRVVDGKAVKIVEHVRLTDILRVARAKAPLYPGWTHISTRMTAIRPTLLVEQVDVAERDARGNTALFAATRTGQANVIDALLRQGADVDARDALGATPLLIAVISIDRRPDVVRRLLDGGADPDAVDTDGTTLLMRAATNNDTTTFRLLRDKGANACARDKRGRTVVDFVSDARPAMRQLATAAVARCRSAR